ncbi:Mannitol dehydrogenase Rossmann domain-containing protein [Cladophialophora immunda]|nr:Mannitol dehydrogenase Rossmann domain-containing protein [Cladophialophora immunda]
MEGPITQFACLSKGESVLLFPIETFFICFPFSKIGLRGGPISTMATAVHFGGGNIGRGFIAELLHETGYEVIFVDIVDDLVNRINACKLYKITEVGEDGEKSKVITNYRAINSKYDMDEVVKCIAEADIVTSAVGPNVLKFVAKPIADGIAARTKSKPVAVIACENMINATDALKILITEKKNMKPEVLKDLPSKAEFGNSVVDRIVPTQPTYANLDIFTESFYDWCVETTGFKSGHPELKGVHWVENLGPYIERKLFTINTSHATAAYFAYHKGIKTIHEAMVDPDIRQEVHEALEETTYLIRDKYGITPQEQQLYIDTIVSRISNRHLQDVPVRVGRAPLRKLGRKERFIGPAAQLAERGYDVTALVRGVEMALRFQNVEGDEESKELAHIMSTLGPEEATTKLTGLQPSHPLYPKILDKVKLVQNETT